MEVFFHPRSHTTATWSGSYVHNGTCSIKYKDARSAYAAITVLNQVTTLPGCKLPLKVCLARGWNHIDLKAVVRLSNPGYVEDLEQSLVSIRGTSQASLTLAASQASLTLAAIASPGPPRSNAAPPTLSHGAPAALPAPAPADDLGSSSRGRPIHFAEQDSELQSPVQRQGAANDAQDCK